MFDGGLCEVYGEAGVVKLAVVVADTVAQFFRLDALKQFVGFGFTEVAGVADAEFAGEAVVQPEAEGVVRRRPPFFARDDKGFAFEEVRRVFGKAAAFAQGFAHEVNVTLREVAHTAVHEFGAAAGGAFGKVAALQEQGRESARSGINGDAESSRAAADDDNVPCFRTFGAFEILLSFHKFSLRLTVKSPENHWNRLYFNTQTLIHHEESKKYRANCAASFRFSSIIHINPTR